MKYIFTVYTIDNTRSSIFEVESDSLRNALRLLAFDIYRTGCSFYWNFVLSPNYSCFTSKGDSVRLLSKKNLDFFRDCYMQICDSSVILY